MFWEAGRKLVYQFGRAVVLRIDSFPGGSAGEAKISRRIDNAQIAAVCFGLRNKFSNQTGTCTVRRRRKQGDLTVQVGRQVVSTDVTLVANYAGKMRKDLGNLFICLAG